MKNLEMVPQTKFCVMKESEPVALIQIIQYPIKIKTKQTFAGQI